MLAMLLAVLLVSYLAPMWMLRGLRAQHSIPARVREGEPFEVSLEVNHNGFLSRSMVEVWCDFAAAEEDQRQHMSFLPLVKQENQTAISFTADYRGVHSVGPLTLKSAFPLGVHSMQRVVPDTSSEIVVLPETFPVGYFPYASGDYMPMLGVNAVSMAGGNDLFFGVREYRHGDNPRHIHWPTSARHNNLIIKEYQYITATELTILLDLNAASNIGQGKHSTLEYAVKIAASVTAHALSEGHHVRLMGFGAEPLDLSVHAGERQMQMVLEALARVQADGDMPYQQALQTAINEVHQSSVLLAFSIPRPGEKPNLPMAAFASKHVKPVWVQMSSDSFLHPVQAKRGGLLWAAGNQPVYKIFCNDDLTQVFSHA